MTERLPTQDVEIPPLRLKGLLTAPDTAKSIVFFAHGRRASR
jgi:hypothetical protein